MTTFHYQIKVHFADVDPAGIMFYPRIFEMVNETIEEWFSSIGFSFSKIHLEDQAGIPLVKIEASFHKPSHLGEVLGFELGVQRVGGSSLELIIKASVFGTSGTTGKPKACVHFHRDIMAMADTFSRFILKPESDEVFAGTPPLSFTFGLGGLLVFPFAVGATTVLNETKGIEALAAEIEKFKVTTLFTSPTAYRALLGFADKYDFSSLKKCVSAGETLPKATSDAWTKATGVRPIDGIGATEIIHIFISASGDDIRPGATGKSVPGYEAVVLDENYQPLPKGNTGFLAVKGPTGCRYLDDDRQEDYVKGGWNVTGDIFHLDEEGYFWFKARSDDMIVSGGYNISGPEVEEGLLTHEAVFECAVVSSPDEKRGNIAKAFVVLQEGEGGSPEMIKTLQDHVKASIAPYKYPRAIEFVSELPKTETGKIQRFKLRQQELAK